MKVLVTGASGFVGKNLCKKLYELACCTNKPHYDIYTPSSSICNLMDPYKVGDFFEDIKPDVVIHLAATVGGIGANQERPADFIHNNLIMGLNVIETSCSHNVDKLIMLGSVCMYPKYCEVPFIEEDIWSGYPEETNAPYGIAKKTLMETGIAYRKQYGLNVVNLIPVNMFGPHDTFNTTTSHVIPALIMKIQEAIDSNSPAIEVWGTGNATREFLYIEDCVDAIIKAIHINCGPEPINIGTGQEIRIDELVNLLCHHMGYKGNKVYDTSKPDGQPRRCLNVHLAQSLLGFKAQIGLEDGLQKTIGWYRDRCNNI